jgi:thioesterase domain-containing protein
MPFIAIALILAASLGGVSIAAHNTVPGNALYGYKVNVEEKLQGALSLSSESRAQWDVSSAQTRLSEAEELASEGKLDAKMEAQITANLNEHAQNIAAEIAALQQSGNATSAARISAQFKDVLTSNQVLITKIQAKNADKNSLIESSTSVGTQNSSNSNGESGNNSSAQDSNIQVQSSQKTHIDLGL